MPLDALGRTRAPLTEPTSKSPWPEGLGNLVKLCRAGDRALQLLLFNEECLVSASHQLALTTSLPLNHKHWFCHAVYKGLISLHKKFGVRLGFPMPRSTATPSNRAQVQTRTTRGCSGGPTRKRAGLRCGSQTK